MRSRGAGADRRRAAHARGRPGIPPPPFPSGRAWAISLPPPKCASPSPPILASRMQWKSHCRCFRRLCFGTRRLRPLSPPQTSIRPASHRFPGRKASGTSTSPSPPHPGCQSSAVCPPFSSTRTAALNRFRRACWPTHMTSLRHAAGLRGARGCLPGDAENQLCPVRSSRLCNRYAALLAGRLGHFFPKRSQSIFHHSRRLGCARFARPLLAGIAGEVYSCPGPHHYRQRAGGGGPHALPGPHRCRSSGDGRNLRTNRAGLVPAPGQSAG